MFDIGFTELLVIGVVALIVVGPKDLPGMFRTLGRFTARARAMAREFQKSLEDAADASGTSDIMKDLKSVTSARNLGLDSVRDAVKDYATSSYDPEESRKKIEAAKAFEASGENTRKLAEKRAADMESAAARASELAGQRAGTTATEAAGTPAAETPAAKKPAAKKPAEKKAAAKKPAAKKPAAKKPAAKKPATKPAARKTAAKNAAAKKPAAKAEQ